MDPIWPNVSKNVVQKCHLKKTYLGHFQKSETGSKSMCRFKNGLKKCSSFKNFHHRTDTTHEARGQPCPTTPGLFLTIIQPHHDCMKTTFKSIQINLFQKKRVMADVFLATCTRSLLLFFNIIWQVQMLWI